MKTLKGWSRAVNTRTQFNQKQQNNENLHSCIACKKKKKQLANIFPLHSRVDRWHEASIRVSIIFGRVHKEAMEGEIRLHSVFFMLWTNQLWRTRVCIKNLLKRISVKNESHSYFYTVCQAREAGWQYAAGHLVNYPSFRDSFPSTWQSTMLLLPHDLKSTWWFAYNHPKSLINWYMLCTHCLFSLAVQLNASLDLNVYWLCLHTLNMQHIWLPTRKLKTHRLPYLCRLQTAYYEKNHK